MPTVPVSEAGWRIEPPVSVAVAASATLLPRGWIPMLFALLFLVWQTFRRRSAALIGLAGLLAAGGAEAQRPSEADLQLRRGQAADAAKRYLAEAKAGRAPDTAYYNAGTAALVAGQLDVARKALEPRGPIAVAACRGAVSIERGAPVFRGLRQSRNGRSAVAGSARAIIAGLIL